MGGDIPGFGTTSAPGACRRFLKLLLAAACLAGATAPAAAAKNLALLVAVTQYDEKTIRPLEGPSNDVMLMWRELKRRGFQAADDDGARRQPPGARRHSASGRRADARGDSRRIARHWRRGRKPAISSCSSSPVMAPPSRSPIRRRRSSRSPTAATRCCCRAMPAVLTTTQGSIRNAHHRRRAGARARCHPPEGRDRVGGGRCLPFRHRHALGGDSVARAVRASTLGVPAGPGPTGAAPGAGAALRNVRRACVGRQGAADRLLRGRLTRRGDRAAVSGLCAGPGRAAEAASASGCSPRIWCARSPPARPRPSAISRASCRRDMAKLQGVVERAAAGVRRRSRSPDRRRRDRAGGAPRRPCRREGRRDRRRHPARLRNRRGLALYDGPLRRRSALGQGARRREHGGDKSCGRRAGEADITLWHRRLGRGRGAGGVVYVSRRASGDAAGIDARAHRSS